MLIIGPRRPDRSAARALGRPGRRASEPHRRLIAALPDVLHGRHMRRRLHVWCAGADRDDPRARRATTASSRAVSTPSWHSTSRRTARPRAGVAAVPRIARREADTPARNGGTVRRARAQVRAGRLALRLRTPAVPPGTARRADLVPAPDLGISTAARG